MSRFCWKDYSTLSLRESFDQPCFVRGKHWDRFAFAIKQISNVIACGERFDYMEIPKPTVTGIRKRSFGRAKDHLALSRDYPQPDSRVIIGCSRIVKFVII